MIETRESTISLKNISWLEGNKFGTSYSMGGVRPFFADKVGLIRWFKALSKEDQEEFIVMYGDEPLIDVRMHLVATEDTTIGDEVYTKGMEVDQLSYELLHAWEV